MRTVNTSTVVFTPGASGVGTLDFSAWTNFDARKLNIVTALEDGNVPIYAVGTSKGATAISGNVITLAFNTTGFNASGKLQVVYDDIAVTVNSVPLAAGAALSSLQVTTIAQLSTANAYLSTIATNIPTIGQKTLSASQPVALASDQIIPIKNGESIIADSFSTFDTTNTWTVVASASGDIIVTDGNAVSCSYLVVSLDPWGANTTTAFESKQTTLPPFRSQTGLARSYQALGKEVAIQYVSTESQDPFIPIQLASIFQSTTTLFFSTSAPHNLNIGDTIAIDGVTDSRLNYPALTIATVTNGVSATATAGPGGNLPSVTLTTPIVSPASSAGTVYFRGRLSSAVNGSSMIFDNATATNASIYVRSDGGTAHPAGGTLAGSHAITINTTASIQAINAPYTYAFQPTSQYEYIYQPDGITWFDKGVDNQTVPTIRAKREQIVPNPAKQYKAKYSFTNNPGVTRPIARIQSISKTGSVIATVTTDVPHGLTSYDVCVLYGVYDQVNFTNVAAATAVTYISPTQFSMVVGTTTPTTTSYGGYVARVNGGNLMSATGQTTNNAISAISRVSNVLSVSGSGTTTWSFSVGDYVQAIGVYQNNGTFLNLDSAYRVQSITTNVAKLEPINGVYSLSGDDIPYTLAGGALVKRLDVRLHYSRVYKYNRSVTEIYNGFSRNDAAAAVPVALVGTNVTVSCNTAQVNGVTVTSTGATASLEAPFGAAGLTYNGTKRQIRTDDAGGVVGPGELVYVGSTFSAGSATPADGTNSKTFYAIPGRDCEMFVGISSQGNGANTMQVEGSWDNVTFSVIPLSRVDNLATGQQYVALSAWVPQTNATYKGRTYGYPFIRIHQTALTTTGTTVGTVRFVPLPIVPGETTSPFTLNAVNLVEAAGTANGNIQNGGVRTLAVPSKGACKVTLIIDAFTYLSAAPTTTSILVEGTNDNVQSTWNTIPLQPLGGGTAVTSITSRGALNQWFSGTFEGDASNYEYVRVRWASLTLPISSYALAYHGALKITPIANSIGIGSSTKPTYSASVYGLTPTAALTAMVIESGASKLTRIKRIRVQPGTAGAAGIATLTINRHTGAASAAGTTLSAASRDQSDDAYSGIIKTGSPTFAGVTITPTNLVFDIPTLTTPQQSIVFDLTNNGTEKGISIPIGVTNGISFTHSGLAGAAGFGMIVDMTEV